MVFIITQTIILLIIIGLLYLLSWFLPTDSPWAPWWTTSKEKSKKLCKLLKLDKKDNFYELGSGTATTLCVAAKSFGVTCVGIESSKSRVWWSRRKVKRLGLSEKVAIIQKDFFNVDLSLPASASTALQAGSATVVYLYLVPRVIKKLKPKLLKELKPGTKVASLVYKIDYLPLVAENKKEQLYIYKIPVRK
jgi:hypothetical protein